MTSIDPHDSLATLVTARPDLAPALEALELDYCCHGATSLADACTASGLVLGEILGDLSASAPGATQGWASMGPPDLVNHLEGIHHAYLSAALPRLGALMERVLGVHGATHPELAAVSDTLQALRSDLEPHLMKEERVLFPMIRELYASDGVPDFHCGTLQNPISMMTQEHDQAGVLLAQLRTLTSGYTPPADGCASYQALYTGLSEMEADTHLHIHKENNLLFPTVVAEESRRVAS